MLQNLFELNPNPHECNLIFSLFIVIFFHSVEIKIIDKNFEPSYEMRQTVQFIFWHIQREKRSCSRTLQDHLAIVKKMIHKQIEGLPGLHSIQPNKAKCGYEPLHQMWLNKLAITRPSWLRTTPPTPQPSPATCRFQSDLVPNPYPHMIDASLLLEFSPPCYTFY